MNAGIQLAQSPTARMLLDLAERRADGSLELGGRRVTLRGGDVVDVSGRPGDPTLDGLLVSAGALDGEAADWACARAIADGRALAEVLRERLPDATIRGALREAWTERLAAAFRDEAQGTPREGEAPDTSEAPAFPGRPSRGGPVFLPEAVLPSAAEGDWEPGESTVALVLDALAVRAEADLRREGGEAAVAALSVQELVWERTPHQVSAARWCGLGLDDDDAGEDEAPRAAKHLDDDEGPGEPGRADRVSAEALDPDSDAEDAAVDAAGARLPGPIAVGPVLDRFPEVASRVAAVVRAGLARLRPRGSGAPTPPPRPPSLVSASAGGASSIPPS
ncbi:MAG TPA: hypothetical protein RMF84_15375, partial [Polyangiaceae bacterium LLY-WYZ-14_1]|nr:hypothetical protein [Polyangiaceae bacterium LLY-WYZ-14_1]